MESAMKRVFSGVILPEATRKPTYAPVVPAERDRLVAELTQSNYINRAFALNHFSRVSRVATWKTDGGLQIDLWETPEAMAGWVQKMPRLLRRLEALRVYYAAVKPVHFICVPLDAPRQLPAEPSQCLDKPHVNGGYTYLNGNQVYLFRKEELPKVLLHEYLHQIQGHKDLDWDADALGRLNTIVGLQVGDLRPNESIVEYWAWMHHTLFLALETGTPWKTLQAAERAFMLEQARRIWTHQQGCAASWTEGTPVFSYYILKAMYSVLGNTKAWRLDYSVPELLSWIETHWPVWKKELTRATPAKQARHEATPATARMTLFGDL